jgi:hypothetical protein
MVAPSNDSIASVNYKDAAFSETCDEYFSTRQEFVIVCTGKAAAKCRKAADLFLRLEVERPAGFVRLACLAKLTWVAMPMATLLAVCTNAIIYGWTVTVPRVGNQVLRLKPPTGSATNKSGLHRGVNAASGNDSLASVNYEDAAFWETCDEYFSTNREFVIACTGKAAARCRKAVELLDRSPKGLERLTFLVQWLIAMRVSPLINICSKATVQGWRVTVRRIENQIAHLAPPSESATDGRRGG